MVSTDSSSYLAQGIRFLESLTAITKRDRLVLWKFKKSDRNKDSVLTEHELDGIESQWKKLASKCTVVFSNTCDKDRNGNVTWSEWTNCLKRALHFTTKEALKPGNYACSIQQGLFVSIYRCLSLRGQDGVVVMGLGYRRSGRFFEAIPEFKPAVACSL